MQDVLHSTGGQVEYRHTNGEMSTIRISIAVIGTRRVHIDKLHPEVSDGVLPRSNGHSGGNMVSSGISLDGG
jgi:hypothetical protein